MSQTRGSVGRTALGSTCGNREPEWPAVEESQRSSVGEFEDLFLGAPAVGDPIAPGDEFLDAFRLRAGKDHDPREDHKDTDDTYDDCDDEDEDDDLDDGFDDDEDDLQDDDE